MLVVSNDLITTEREKNQPIDPSYNGLKALTKSKILKE